MTIKSKQVMLMAEVKKDRIKAKLESLTRKELNEFANEKLQIENAEHFRTKKLLIGHIFEISSFRTLRMKLEIPTWWDKHRNEFFGWSSVIGLILAIVFYLLSSNENRSSNSSDVRLIDGSLDPNDSPYEQKMSEDGTKKIEPKDMELIDSLVTQPIKSSLQADYKSEDKGNQSNVPTRTQKSIHPTNLINIENVNDDQRYGFPTIDFKFQNVGNITAFLWKFTIDITEIEIDTTPALEFQLLTPDESRMKGYKERIGNNVLDVLAINNGWGAAEQCIFLIDERGLSQLFSDSIRSFKGRLSSGESKVIIRLVVDQIDSKKFNQLHDVMIQNGRKALEEQLINESKSAYYKMREKEAFESYKKEKWIEFNQNWNYSGRTIPISTPSIQWKYKNIKGIVQSGLAKAYNRTESDYPPIWSVIVGTDKFWWQYDIPSYYPKDSYVTYCAIIDPSAGKHERSYAISREIPPGDVERFHIMIGSSKSSHLRMRLKFYVDKNKIIQSEEFELKIWNPRNSYLNEYYEDGDMMLRSLNILEQNSDTVNLNFLRMLLKRNFRRYDLYSILRDLDGIEEKNDLKQLDSLRIIVLEKLQNKFGKYPFFEKNE